MARWRSWPDDDELLLLDAALAPPAKARAAWSAWCARGSSIADSAPRSARLLPAVAANAAVLEPSPADHGRLRGIARHTWTANQVRLAAAGRALAGLDGVGSVMAIKGLAMICSWPGGLRLRTMDDIDLLVRETDADRASSALLARGVTGADAGGIARARRVAHAVTLIGPGGVPIDLHWRPRGRVGGDEDDLWRTAVPFPIGDRSILLPSPEHAFVHACLHAFGSVPSGPVWALDCVLTARHATGGLDWDRVGTVAVAHDEPGAVLEALELLHTRGWLDVPAEVRARLRVERPALGVRLRERAVAGRPALPVVAPYLELFEQYRRLARFREQSVTPGDYLRFLADVSALDGPRQLPRHWLRRSGQRLAASVPRRLQRHHTIGGREHHRIVGND